MGLNELKVNSLGKICFVKTCNLKRRFMDMGFNRGVNVRPILVGGSMRVYSIKGSLIGIRDDDAKNIEVDL